MALKWLLVPLEAIWSVSHFEKFPQREVHRVPDGHLLFSLNTLQALHTMKYFCDARLSLRHKTLSTSVLVFDWLGVYKTPKSTAEGEEEHSLCS